MIKIQNAYKIYELGGEKVKALDGVSLKISDGEFVAIVGPSGSGKSTFLHMIGGIDSLDKGEVFVDQVNLEEMNDNRLARYRNKTVGFIFQQFNLQTRYTALDNVKLPLIFSGISNKERDKKARNALSKVGLSDRMKHKPSELSGGQQQRVCIARALVNDPSILLADEPTGNLDSKSGERIIKMLRELNNKLKVTTIVVTHDDRIAHKADRILRILDGKIVDDVMNGKDVAKKYTD
jgi:putative ABC transport system ATP-binding protein